MLLETGVHPAADNLELSLADEIAFVGPPLRTGRLEHINGLHTLIRAWKGLSRFDLVVAGTGREEKHLRPLAAGKPCIRFLGPPTREALITGGAGFIGSRLAGTLVWPAVRVRARGCRGARPTAAATRERSAAPGGG